MRPIVKTSDSFLYRFFDVRVIDGIVNGAGALAGWTSRTMRIMQTGVVQNYAALIVVGLVIVLGLIIL